MLAEWCRRRTRNAVQSRGRRCQRRLITMANGSIRPKAVLIGLLVDIGGSLLVGFLLGVVVVAIAAATHQMSPAQLAHLAANVPLKIVGLIGTLLATFVGGYVAARIGRPHAVPNALAVGVISLLLGILLWLREPVGVTPLWKAISGLLLTIPAALGGGLAASKRSN